MNDRPIHRLADEITIRPATCPGDYQACQEAQRLAWGIREEGYVLPIATMVGANMHGGLVLGAFLPDGRAVAVSFAFLGRVEGELCLYSQLTGVVPGHQSRGLGYQLKLVQREFARDQGLGLIVWAFDPLQAGNAHFNLHRLGARARRYVEDMYGPRTDALNAGVPTDRLIAEWDVRREPESEAMVAPQGEIDRHAMIRTEIGQGGLRVPAGLETEIRWERVFLEIPADIGRLRRDAPGVAEDWRSAVRGAFQTLFAAGYRATDLIRREVSGELRCYYVMKREEARSSSAT
jgi:predicted GNAT superfamily acetyltransferase